MGCLQAAKDYGALPDAKMVLMARSGEGAGRMPMSAEILESLLPAHERLKLSSSGEQVCPQASAARVLLSCRQRLLADSRIFLRSMRRPRA